MGILEVSKFWISCWHSAEMTEISYGKTSNDKYVCYNVSRICTLSLWLTHSFYVFLQSRHMKNMYNQNWDGLENHSHWLIHTPITTFPSISSNYTNYLSIKFWIWFFCFEILNAKNHHWKLWVGLSLPFRQLTCNHVIYYLW